MTHVCIITPPSGFLLDARVFPTLGILKVGAALEQAAVKVDHLDLTGVENFETAAREYSGNPDAFALTATTPQIPAAIQIRRCLSGKVILGGPHATLVHAAAKRGNERAQKALDELLTEFDVVVAGDGEKAIFIAINSRGLVDADDPKSALWQSSQDFSESPWPARHLIDMDSYHYSVDGKKAASAVFQLGCPFESITGDSFIFTSRGFETVNEFRARLSVAIRVNGGQVFKIAESITTMDGVSQASHFIEESVRDVYEVRHKFGIPLRGTPEHKVMTVQGDSLEWRSISQLRPGDWIASRFPESVNNTIQPLNIKAVLREVPLGGFLPRRIRTPKLMNTELAWLTGFMLGDGCIPLDGRPAIHVCVTADVRERLIAAFRNLFNVELRIYPTRVTKNMQHGWVHSRAVYEFFVQTLGINPAHKLHVPDIIRISPRSVIQSFIDGLWDADGYTSGSVDYLTTVDSEFAREVSMLLMVAGVVPFLRRIKGNRYAHGACWRVGIVQGERLPIGCSIYKSKKSGEWYWRTKKSANRTGIRRRTLWESGLSHPLDINGIFYSQVKEVVPAGREQVFDLTVPDGENFVANGIIVHNCGFCGGRLSPMLRRIRTRTSESVIAEMLHLHEQYGFDAVQAYDDELNVNRGLVDLLRKIKDTGIDWRLRGFVKAELFTEEQAEAMYAAGFRWLLCGFESGHPKILRNINKKATREDNTRMLRIAHKYGLKVKALMSIGHPGESEETIMATRDWLLEEKPDDFDMTVVTLYPGTPYFDSSVCIEEPLYKYEFNGDALYSENVDFTKEVAYYKGIPGQYHSFVWTDYLSRERLATLRDYVEDDVRTKLGIPYPTAVPALNYEHSTGMTPPPYILRSSR